MSFGFRLAVTLIAVAFLAVVFTSFSRPPVATSQNGYRGTGMDQVFNPRTVAAAQDVNALPEEVAPQDNSGQLSSQAYKNIQVLKNVDANELLRLMQAMTDWVAPSQGCNYCHNPDDLAADNLYTKIVARQMLRMTQHINMTWKSHVSETGVTCFTCHRGQPVPTFIWFQNPGPMQAGGMAETGTGQNMPAPSVGLTSLPYDPLATFLATRDDVRVVSTTALPEGSGKSIKSAEATYGLMMYMSEALGVNCTYCHNTRSFTSWDQSTPQRAIAWYGIRMVRDLIANFLEPLKQHFPVERLGVAGDVPKLACGTCHKGFALPLNGASMVKDYPELRTSTE